MQWTLGPPPRARALAIGLTILAHAAAISLIYVERHASRSTPIPELQYVSTWLEARTESQPATVANTEVPIGRKKPAQNSQRADLPPQTLLAPATAQQLQPSDFTEPIRMPVMPRVDWNAEVAGAAARLAAEDGRSGGFSAAPNTLREPCKPRIFDKETQREMAARLPNPPDPDAVGPDPSANCIIVGGFPKCVQKIEPKKRGGRSAGDLFKDRLAGKQPVSSVPSPYICD
jgi:hypothetical protein